MKENKKLVISIALVLLLGVVVAGGTFAWWTWTSSESDKTSVTFQVPSGSNQLKAILDSDTSNVSGMAPAASCAGTYSKMVTIQLYYQNETGADASLNATLKLASISEAANSNTYKSVIKWALSTSGEKSTCDANIIEEGTLNNVAINGEIYSGDLTAGTIPENTSMGLKKTLYLYFWIDGPNYNVTNTGNSVVNDPLQDLSLKVVWEGTISNAPTLYATIAGQSRQTAPASFASAPTDAESGVYQTTQAMSDGNHTIYYYRGNVRNNNVKFGGYCWKIVRTTKTGGIKMIYNGLPDSTTGNCGEDTTTSQIETQDKNGVYDGKSSAKLDGTNIEYTFNTNRDNAQYVDYRTSEIKTNIDTWFNNQNTSEHNFDQTMLETTDFCIDMEVDTSETRWTQYMPSTRVNNNNPNLSCTGTYKYPNEGKVGLLTSDEVMYAGATGSGNNTYYLYNNKSCWLLSPGFFRGGDARVWYIYFTGHLYSNRVFFAYGARPVVSLASGVKYDGEGTYNNPYIPKR